MYNLMPSQHKVIFNSV